MKKRYFTPTCELIELGTADFMVPNQMSSPTVGGANNYAFDEDEENENANGWLLETDSHLWD